MSAEKPSEFCFGVDPDLVPGLTNLPDLRNLGLENVLGIRKQMTEYARARLPEVNLEEVEFAEKSVPGGQGTPDVRILLYRPRRPMQMMPALLHFHGGGLVFGSPEARHTVAVDLVRTFNCVIASVDYRMAPEWQYPAAVEDGYAVLRWMLGNASAFGIDPARISVVGESAGGGLAACLAILARERGEVHLRSQILTYPMLDDRTGAEDYPHIGQHVWTRANNQFGWKSYLGDRFGTQSVPPTAAAARCADFTGLPPAYIAIGDLDLFIVETLTYAKELMLAGVRVDLRIYPGAFHGFDLIEQAAISKRFKADLKASIGRALAL